MPIRCSLRRLFLSSAILAALVCDFSAANALEKIRVLIPVRNIDEAFSPFVVAKEKGYFADEGYDVTLIAVGAQTSPPFRSSSGNAEVGAASPGEALVGVQSGKLDIRYFYGLVLFQHLVCWGRCPIVRLRALPS